MNTFPCSALPSLSAPMSGFFDNQVYSVQQVENSNAVPQTAPFELITTKLQNKELNIHFTFTGSQGRKNGMKAYSDFTLSNQFPPEVVIWLSRDVQDQDGAKFSAIIKFSLKDQAFNSPVRIYLKTLNGGEEQTLATLEQ